MSNLHLLEAAYHLAEAVDRATDSVVHEEVASIVKLHAKIAVASAWIPIPGVDLAAMVTNTWTMYVRINKTVNIPFSEHWMRSLATGIGTNLLSNLPGFGVLSILKLFPGIGSFWGGVIISSVAYPFTIAAGIVYMRVLAMLLKQQSALTEVNLKAAVNAITKDKDAMKQIWTEATREYELAKASGELKK